MYGLLQQKTPDYTVAKVHLGQKLFYENGLSVNRAMSCGSCHNPDMAFTDGYRRSKGTFADLHKRNAPSLVNVSTQRYLNWADPHVSSLEDQMTTPLFGNHPIEMGLDSTDVSTINTIASNREYRTLFLKAFPDEEEPVSWRNIKSSIAAFVSGINSYNSPYDRYLKGDTFAISEAAKQGKKLFFSHRFNCSSCHVAPVFGASNALPFAMQYHNKGLYHINGNYPAEDQGLYEVDKIPGNKGKFKTPSLRNLSFTSPYFHDGSVDTIGEAVQISLDGGRNVTVGDKRGDGRKNPYKSPLIKTIKATALEKQQLIAFLETLNDSTISVNSRFRKPDDKDL